MGLEYSKWSESITPEHDVNIAFTRMLAGPMDFTPGGFRNAARGKFEARDIAPMTQGTRAHQLAMYVVYESPLVMVSDYPEAYEGPAGDGVHREGADRVGRDAGARRASRASTSSSPGGRATDWYDRRR